MQFGSPQNALTSGQGQMGIGSLLQGLFGNSGQPYQQAGNTYNNYMQQAMKFLQPYMGGGEWAMPREQNILSQMSDPQAFVNKILGGYQMSPMAQMELKQGQNAQNNAASASGMLGSSALMKSSADYAQDLTSQDMQTYLQNILGVNSQALGGLSGMQGRGLQAGGAMSDLMSKLAQGMAQSQYGQSQGQQNDLSSLFSGGMSLLSLFGL